ncbi:MAG: cation:proton antiporter [Candidatus Hinthialibacter antarcticus]|nr:cation:proton antiporter [Candidatus Hinthialibacter antarcticus]
MQSAVFTDLVFLSSQSAGELPILNDLAIIVGLSAVVLYVISKLKIPSIVGFLLTGMLIGPYGLQWIEAVHEVEVLAEIGVVLLLFTIGVEFSLTKIAKLKIQTLVGGSLQTFGTVFLFFLIYMCFGAPMNTSVFVGCLIALSSTAVALKILQDRAEIESPYGRNALAILIFQDVMIVPMMLIAPILAGQSENPVLAFFAMGAKGVLIVIVVYLLARFGVPKLLYSVTRTRSSEMFLLAIISIGLVVAWFTSWLGLSLGLGAFMAGLIISESEYSHQAMGGVLPFRDLFISFFFVSIGMLLNVEYFFLHFPLIIIATILVMSLKMILVCASVILIGSPLRTAVLTGAAICQIGEFSFILASVGLKYDLISDSAYQLFLAVSILSMIFTPFVIQFAPLLAKEANRLPLPERLKHGMKPEDEAAGPKRNDHVIIIGFGVNGGNLARTAQAANIPYVIIEMNPETVRTQKTKGEPIFYGDAAHEAVLEHACIHTARILVITIADPAAAARIIELSKRLNPSVYLIARTRFMQEVQPLFKLGADEVIPEEYETSIEIFTRVLMKYLVSKDSIEQMVGKIRSDGYQMFRSPSPRKLSLNDLELNPSEFAIHTLQVSPDSPAVGRSLEDINMRKKYGLTAVAVRRYGKILPNPEGHWVIYDNDALIVLGPPDKIAPFVETML